MNHLNDILLQISIFLVGLCIGSFLNVCICRIPEGRSVVKPGSACMKCGHRLTWWENIPIVSFIILRAKCSSCGARISFQYPVVEALTGVTILLLWRKFNLTPDFFIYSCFVATLIIITFIDLEHQLIPDVLSLPMIALGLISSFFLADLKWYDSLIGILLGGGVLYLVAGGYYLLTHKEGMGGGDIKLLAMIGAFLGWKAIPLVVFISAGLGSVTGIVLILMQKAERRTAIPYGPFLALAAMITIFYGNELTAWYLNLSQG
ncbi:MAG: prepilin peptidase [Dissulfurimicrobium sp.]|uniref:prepilin peptidase n=1 Tax=Dissulfurimicrobium TaxID=1769732 RepID=UPI001EDBFF20|nr:A24 family peptidase [Dissulfurimicrobium hydrothermale]UKL13080.1 A24 family peptidase [Dissulfurimicrobium hydrothermale]